MILKPTAIFRERDIDQYANKYTQIEALQTLLMKAVMYPADQYNAILEKSTAKPWRIHASRGKISETDGQPKLVIEEILVNYDSSYDLKIDSKTGRIHKDRHSYYDLIHILAIEEAFRVNELRRLIDELMHSPKKTTEDQDAWNEPRTQPEQSPRIIARKFLDKGYVDPYFHHESARNLALEFVKPIIQDSKDLMRPYLSQNLIIPSIISRAESIPGVNTDLVSRAGRHVKFFEEVYRDEMQAILRSQESQTPRN